MFVKKGDKVRVIAGKDKGTEAVVLTALPKVNKQLSTYQTFKFWTKMV